jgi:hypothetical protein
MRRIRADRITPGTILHNGHLSPLHVEEVGENSLGSIVLRCSHTPGTYPATTLLLPPHELVETI